MPDIFERNKPKLQPDDRNPGCKLNFKSLLQIWLMDLQLLLTGLEKFPLNNSIGEIAGNLGLTIRRMQSGLPAFSSGF